MARSLLDPLIGADVEKQPVTTIKDAYDLKARDRFYDVPHKMTALYYGTNTSKTITGRFQIGNQYHFHMEAQTTVCLPTEDGMDVHSSTQWMDYTNIAISECLNIPENSINMIVRRLGGSYGAKITRSSQIACACALACHLTNQPVRFVMSIESNMTTCGKRYSSFNEYKVEVDDDGKIQKLRNNYVQDAGCSLNDSFQMLAVPAFKNCYSSDTWNNKGQEVKTDAPCNSSCRAPGSMEAIAMIENIMEHIAREVGKDPISVRMANLEKDSQIKTMMPDFLKDVDYTKRKQKIDDFNKKNRWRKRGIAVVPMKYPLKYVGSFPAYVCIYHYDGTVAISHGGIEMGQGINTKVAQVAAHVLGIPYEFVKVKPSNNLISANAFVTGGSMTSDTICFAVKKACEELLERLEPVRTLMKDAKWPKITKAAYDKNIDLSVKSTFKPTDLENYNIWGLSCAEIETDLLTGSIQLRRVDILEDTGESISPLVDVGQIEGAFVMGIGYWLMESLVYDRVNGELLTNRTLNYKPPGAKDIPVDFRIKFLQKSSNPFGVLRSKATGEPAICMSIVVIFALRYALESARKNAGITEPWLNLGAPATPEVIFLNSGNSIGSYTL